MAVDISVQTSQNIQSSRRSTQPTLADKTLQAPTMCQAPVKLRLSINLTLPGLRQGEDSPIHFSLVIKSLHYPCA